MSWNIITITMYTYDICLGIGVDDIDDYDDDDEDDDGVVEDGDFLGGCMSIVGKEGNGAFCHHCACNCTLRGHRYSVFSFYSVSCTLYIVHCILYLVHCKLNIAGSPLQCICYR